MHPTPPPPDGRRWMTVDQWLAERSETWAHVDRVRPADGGYRPLGRARDDDQDHDQAQRSGRRRGR